MSAQPLMNWENIDIQKTILQQVIEKPTYTSVVLPYLKEEYFNSTETQTIFKQFNSYKDTYENIPTKKELVLSIKTNPNIPEKVKDSTLQEFKRIYSDIEQIDNYKFLLEKTQEFIMVNEFKKHILNGAQLIQQNGDMSPVVEGLEKALQINFDENLGTSFYDIDDTIEHFHRVMEGLSTGISSLDVIMGGGLYKKTLNVFAAVTHGGKSLIMSSIASHLLLVEKKDVLFITLEMPEKEVLKRIYANVLNIDVNTFKSYSKEELKNIHQKAIDQGLGNLMVKEYPTGTLSTNMLRGYIDRYFAKFKKMPDVIMVDYLTIMKANSMNENTSEYVYYKKVSEELRALAMELDVPIVTAAQLNRSGFANGKEAGLDAVSSSLGIAMTADTFFILSRTQEMDALGQVYLAAKKNRNTGDLSQIIVGIEWSRMRFYGLDNSQIHTHQPINQNNMNNNNSNNNNNMYDDLVIPITSTETSLSVSPQPIQQIQQIQQVQQIQPVYDKQISTATNIFGNVVDFDF